MKVGKLPKGASSNAQWTLWDDGAQIDVELSSSSCGKLKWHREEQEGELEGK
jgi:hypothetical protein